MKKAFSKVAKAQPVTAEKRVEAALKNAQTSGILKLTDANLTEFPSQLSNLGELKLVEKWWETTPLTKIDLSNNSILQIPSDINNHQELQHLQLFNNKISTIPETLFALKMLKFIDISINQVQQFPNAIGECNALVKVEIRANGNKLTAIPNEICGLSNLEVIDLSSNQILAIPNGFGALRKLKKINLKENKIVKISNAISKLSLLSDIDLSSNAIEAIEKGAFSEMCSLVILNLCQNKLTEFSEIPLSQKLDSILVGNNRISKISNLKNAPNLTVLDISTNKINSFPEAVLELKKIKTLNLQNNDICDIPPQLALLDELVRIGLEGNPLKALKSTMRTANAAELKKYLKNKLQGDTKEDSTSTSINDKIAGNKLILRGMGVTDIPQECYKYVSSITDINISNNQLCTISNDISKFTKLASLNASENKLVDVTNKLCDLTFMKVLQLSNNKIKCFLRGVASTKLCLMTIQIIDLNGNDLGKIPSSLKYLPKLDTVCLANNHIEDMSKIARKEFTSLTVLDLSNNKIQIVPNALAIFVTNLQQLCLTNNNISKLPPNLCKLESIKTLSVEGNPIKMIRYDVIKKGTGAIIDFLKKMYTPQGDEPETIPKDSDEETPIMEEKKEPHDAQKQTIQINTILVKQNEINHTIQQLSEKLKYAHDTGEKSDIRKQLTAKSKEYNDLEAYRKSLMGVGN